MKNILTSMLFLPLSLFGQFENHCDSIKLPNSKFWSLPFKNDNLIADTNLYDIKSKYKLLVFVASWCDSCFLEVPVLTTQFAALESKGCKFIAINIDYGLSNWLPHMSKYPSRMIHLNQGGPSWSGLYKFLGIQKIPFNVLLDEDNNIIKSGVELDELETLTN